MFCFWTKTNKDAIAHVVEVLTLNKTKLNIGAQGIEGNTMDSSILEKEIWPKGKKTRTRWMLPKNQYMKSLIQTIINLMYFVLPTFMYVKDSCKPDLGSVSFCTTDSRFSHQK